MHRLLVLLIPCSAALAAPPGSPADIARLSLRANPEIEALDARVEALRAGVTAASARPDPVVGLEYSNMPLTTPWPGEHPMSGVQVRVSQRLLGAGKVDARVAEARAGVRAESASLARLQNGLAGAAVEGWVALGRVRQLRQVTHAHVRLLDQFIDVVQVSYEVGRAAQHELLQLQTLRDRLRDDLRDFDRREKAQLVRLNAALRRESGAAIETPERFDPPDVPERETALAAIEGHPRLTELTEAAAAASGRATRALAEQTPDVTLSAGYRARRAVDGGDPGEDFISVGASMPLPWLWNDERWGSQASGQRARARALEAAARAERDRLRGEVDAHLVDIARGIEKAETYAGPLVEVAHKSLDSAFAAYRVGRASFGDVFQAERMLLDLERGAIVARADAAARAARLRTLTGAWVPKETP